MIEKVATIQISEVDLAPGIHAVLARVQEGVEVIVERDHHLVAIIKTPQRPGRKISECIALAKAFEGRLGCTPTPDADFARDVQAAIDNPVAVALGKVSAGGCMEKLTAKERSEIVRKAAKAGGRGRAEKNTK